MPADEQHERKQRHVAPTDDAALFRRAVGVVRPLANDRVGPEPRHPRPVPRRAPEAAHLPYVDMLSDGTLDVDTHTDEEVVHLAPGLQTRLLRRLRRGQIHVEAALDLHGMTVTEARDALAIFLADCGERGRRCVRIVHGKGRGSRDGRGVLRAKVGRWLRLRDDVAAFCPARRDDGGDGAVYVLLRQHA